MINHSSIKLVLFMSAGLVAMNLHTLNLNDIKGFGRKKPLFMIVFYVVDKAYVAKIYCDTPYGNSVGRFAPVGDWLHCDGIYCLVIFHFHLFVGIDFVNDRLGDLCYRH